MKSEVYHPSTSIVLKVAHSYYVQRKSQKEIAAELNISGATVSRLLRRAEQEGIVSFEIRSPYSECIRLEEELREKHGLKEVIVVPCLRPESLDDNQEEEEQTKMLVALEAARYVQRVLTSHDLLGIAWGGTMYHLIQLLNPCRKVGAGFITLHGSLSCCDYELDVNTLVQRMAMAFGGRHSSILSEGLMDTGEQINSLKSQERIRQIFDSFDKVTISVSGIGSLYPKADSPLSRLQYLKAEEFDYLRKKGVYGDLVLRFFDENGCECETDLRERTLAIDMDSYRKIPTKLIAASGAKKADTLRAALKGKLVDILVVDYWLAKAINQTG